MADPAGGGGGGWRLLTQVCVMRFAELLLSAEAQLELGLVGAAKGVSVLQGGEGVAGVAVRDEAKVVPGGEEGAGVRSLSRAAASSTP